jgi:hypothetical protein
VVKLAFSRRLSIERQDVLEACHSKSRIWFGLDINGIRRQNVTIYATHTVCSANLRPSGANQLLYLELVVNKTDPKLEAIRGYKPTEHRFSPSIV